MLPAFYSEVRDLPHLNFAYNSYSSTPMFVENFTTETQHQKRCTSSENHLFPVFKVPYRCSVFDCHQCKYIPILCIRCQQSWATPQTSPFPVKAGFHLEREMHSSFPRIPPTLKTLCLKALVLRCGAPPVLAETLPSILLSDRKRLPSCACIYFVIEDQTILYIGRSKNLANRWIAHHKLNELLLRKSEIKIAWFEVESVRSVARLEEFLIEYIKPVLNQKNTLSDPVTARFTCIGEPKLSKFTFRVTSEVKREVELASRGKVSDWVREAIIEQLERKGYKQEI